MRLTATGAPDMSFGAAGMAAVTVPDAAGLDQLSVGVVIASGDRPQVALGVDSGGSPRIAVARLTEAGLPDTSFSADGSVVTALPAGPVPFAGGMAIDDSGRVLVVGQGNSSCPGPFCTRSGFVARFTADGALDSAYGTNGYRLVTTTTSTTLRAVTALAGGAALVGGQADLDALVGPLDATGTLDAGFGTGGVRTDTLGHGAGFAIAGVYGITSDAQGRPLISSQVTPAAGNARFGVSRLTSTGDMDASFGPGTWSTGTIVLPAPQSARGNDIAVGCDSAILVTGAGARTDAPQGMVNGNQIALARITPAGILDTSFAPSSSTPGVALGALGEYAAGESLALAPGAALVAGMRRVAPNDLKPVVLRYTAGETCAGTPASTPPPATTPSAPVADPISVINQSRPPAALPKFTKLVGLPSAKRCVSRRSFAIRLRVPKDSTVTQASVRVNGKQVEVRRGTRLRSAVNLKTLPKGRFTVQIVLKLADGRTVKGTRAYRTCTIKRRSGRKLKV